MAVASAPARRGKPPEHLADRLVLVAEELLENEGLEGLTMRAVARRAGVTHGAPLRHYSSFAALLSEVAARGFEGLIAAVDADATAVARGAGAAARLAACAHAYVSCAVARPQVFALMFRPELLDMTHERLATQSRASFDQLVHYVRAAQDAGWQTDKETRPLAGALWALVHGLASLWSQHALSAAVPGVSLDDMLATAVDLVSVSGHAESVSSPHGVGAGLVPASRVPRGAASRGGTRGHERPGSLRQNLSFQTSAPPLAVRKKTRRSR